MVNVTKPIGKTLHSAIADGENQGEVTKRQVRVGQEERTYSVKGAVWDSGALRVPARGQKCRFEAWLEKAGMEAFANYTEAFGCYPAAPGRVIFIIERLVVEGWKFVWNRIELSSA